MKDVDQVCKFVTPKEARRLTGLCGRTLRKYADAGRIEHMVVGTEKLRLYRYDVEAYLKANVKKATS